MSIIGSIIEAIKNRIRPDMTKEEVEQAMQALDDGTPGKSNWRESSDDLLKLLGLPNGFKAREALQAEIDPSVYYSGSVAQNIALHKEILRKVAEHDIHLPANKKPD